MKTTKKTAKKPTAGKRKTAPAQPAALKKARAAKAKKTTPKRKTAGKLSGTYSSTFTLENIKQGGFVVDNVYYRGGDKARIDGHWRYGVKRLSKWYSVRGIKRTMSDNFVSKWL
jgi:hypothetical protein